VAITILEGSNFCICDANGDFSWATSGLFAHDTRFLSLLALTVNGERPLLLSAGKVEYYSAAFFLRNPVGDELPQDSVAIARHRFVGEGMQDRLIVHNNSMDPVAFELALEVGNDFADIFTVKNHDFALGDPQRAQLPPLAEAQFDESGNQFVIEDDHGQARTQVILSRPGHVEPGKVRYWIELETRGMWMSKSSRPWTASRSGRGPRSSVSATNANASRRPSRPGSSASRSSAHRGTTSTTRSRDRSPTWPRSASTAARGSATCLRPGCRGS
jgi:hypothetical protein